RRPHLVEYVRGRITTPSTPIWFLVPRGLVVARRATPRDRLRCASLRACGGMDLVAFTRSNAPRARRRLPRQRGRTHRDDDRDGAHVRELTLRRVSHGRHTHRALRSSAG